MESKTRESEQPQRDTLLLGTWRQQSCPYHRTAANNCFLW